MIKQTPGASERDHAELSLFLAEKFNKTIAVASPLRSYDLSSPKLLTRFTAPDRGSSL